MVKLLAQYRNGNYNVRLFSDGTKIRYNDLDNLTPDFAESCDVSITTVCNGGCNFCYLDCSENGQHADLNDHIFDTVHAGMELALNANDLTHPDLENFLIRMRDKHVFCNLTINQIHLASCIDKLKEWQDKHLVWGIGVSLRNSNDPEFLKNIQKLDNVVVHVIDGLFTKEDIDNLKGHNVKLLILGYKIVGRGVKYYEEHKDEINANIKYLSDTISSLTSEFNGIAFDNLSITHLDMQSKVSPELWKTHFMGEEGSHTFYYDAVHKKFAVSSLETTQFNALGSFDEMFNFVRKRQGFIS